MSHYIFLPIINIILFFHKFEQLQPVKSGDSVFFTAAVIAEVSADCRGFIVGRVRNIGKSFFGAKFPRTSCGTAGKIFAFCIEPRAIKSGNKKFSRSDSGNKQMLVKSQQLINPLNCKINTKVQYAKKKVASQLNQQTAH